MQNKKRRNPWHQTLIKPGSCVNMKDQRGFTLVELIVVVAIFAALVTIVVAMTTSNLQKHRLSGSSRELLADFQRARMDALTTSSPGATTRGFGIRFSSPNTYFLFEFNDANGNFNYDDDSEEFEGEEKTLAPSVTVQRLSGGALVNPSGADDDIILYDKRGMLRDVDWSTVAGATFVLQVPGVTPSRCVVISPVRIREGVWDGAECDAS